MTTELIFGDSEVKEDDGFIIKVVEMVKFRLWDGFANSFARRLIFLKNPKLQPRVTGDGLQI